MKIKDLVELLKVSEQTIIHWIEQGKIPFYKVGSQYRFSETEINEWIINNKLKKNLQVSDKIMDLSAGKKHVVISEMIARGGVFPSIPGDTVEEIIRNSVAKIELPAGIDAGMVNESLLERESMMPTAIGHGIAVPHPRNPIITDVENESLTICFLEHPIEYGAIDGNKVHTIFIILSANSRRHLEILSKISFLAQNQDFYQLLTAHAGKEQIIDFIMNKEKEWLKE